MEILKNKKQLPLTIMVHGLHGVGKTTLGSQAEDAIFISAEDLSHTNVARFNIATSFEDIEKQLNTVLKEDHSFKTLVIDTLDSVEKLAHKHIITTDPANTIAEARGGFGKGYVEAEHMLRRLVTEFIEPIRIKRNMNILLLAHSVTESVEDPFHAITYQRTSPKLHQAKNTSTRAVFTEYVQCLFYLCHDIVANNGHAVSSQRVLITSPTPTCDAKNRFNFPEKIPFRKEGTWDKIIAFINNFYKGEKNEQ